MSSLNEKVVQCKIGARTQTIVKIQIPNSKSNELLIHSQEIDNGIYLGNTIVKANNDYVHIPVLNCTTEDYVMDTNFMPTYSNFKNFKIIENNEYGGKILTNFKRESSNERINSLLSSIKIDENLTKEEKKSVEELCIQFSDVFLLEGDNLSYTPVLSHNIPTKSDQAPINTKQYRTPEIHKKEIEKQVKEMLDQNIISESKSPWNSPLLIVPKKSVEGKKRWRVVVDFRKLNEVTIKDAFPLPRIEEILDQLGHCQFFTTLDLASGYHQVLINPADRVKTAFSTSTGHYEFNRMPFGLTGAPATFQRIMNHILTGLHGIDCFVYLDDIVIYGKNLEQHNEKLSKVLAKLRQHNLKLNTEKCNFLCREVSYLGHICSEAGASPDPAKTQCVSDFPIPKTIKQVQSFLGLTNYYRKFIPQFSKIAAPITKLLRKENSFKWSPDCEISFKLLKKAISSPPILIYPDFTKQFILTTDASNEALGAVLSQGNVGEDKPIAYASRSLNKSEKNYSTIEKELLAIVWACKHFRTYLLGRPFSVYTDHRPLIGVFNVKDPTTRLIRFHHKLSEYDYKIIYKPGKTNCNADALSRIYKENDNIKIVQTRSKTQKNKQNLDTEKNNKQTTEKDNNKQASRDDFQVLKNPEDIQTVLRDFHKSVLGGHQGMAKTYARIRRQFRWKNMQKDIANYIRNCEKCQKNKSGKLTKMPMVLTDTPCLPFDKVYMDMVGVLPLTYSGNRYILTFQDDLTKYMTCVAIPDAEASTVARAFYEEIVTRFCIPKTLVTDNGTNFTSKLFSETCKLLGVKKVHITAYHPQANGSLERSHRPLAEYLRSFVDNDDRCWDQWLRQAMHVHNNTVHTATKLTPTKSLYGFEFEMPTNLKRTATLLYNAEDYPKILQHQLQKTHELARKNLALAKQKSKQQYDHHTNPASFAVGEKVLLKNPTRKNKFSAIWLGPYEVVSVNDSVNTNIRVGGKTKRVHNNQLKAYHNQVNDS